jgi:hypothetical protein
MIGDVTEANPATHLFPEKREPKFLNQIHEGSLEKKLGGEADDTEGNEDDENKKQNRTELRHGFDHSSILRRGP